MKKINLIKNNIIFNVLNIISGLLFTIIIFPYISRVLNPSGVGKVTFINSISLYFLMFASLGIPLYGIREVAKVRDNLEKMQKIVSEIFIINLLMTIFISCIYYLLIFLGILGKELILLKIMGFNILFTFIGIEWFFQGIEEYEYISKRSILFKVISLILIFLFVKKKEDYIIYGLISVFAVVGSNFCNFYKLRNYIKITIKNLNLKKHIKPILLIFSMNIAISIYTNLDNVMLGYKSTEASVGLYSSGIKLVKLVIGIVTSLGAVLLPRISNYIENNLEKELKDILNKTFKILLLLAFPCIIGLYLSAKEIILIFSGKEFIEAIVTMKILTPIIIFIGLSNFIGIQVLYPRGEEKKVLISVVVGAITNFGLNWIFIPKYAQNGAALSTTIAEGLVLLVQIILGYKYLNFIKLNFELFKGIIASVLMGFVIMLCDIDNIYYNLILKIILGGIIYTGTLLILKEELIYEALSKVIKRGKNEKI
ncbi:flippase [Cetobacterium ceti]